MKRIFVQAKDYATREAIIAKHNANKEKGGKEISTDFGTQLQPGKQYKGTVVGFKQLEFTGVDNGQPFELNLVEVKVEGLDRNESIACSASKLPNEGAEVTIEATAALTGSRMGQLFARFAKAVPAAAPIMA